MHFCLSPTEYKNIGSQMSPSRYFTPNEVSLLLASGSKQATVYIIPNLFKWMSAVLLVCRNWRCLLPLSPRGPLRYIGNIHVWTQKNGVKRGLFCSRTYTCYSRLGFWNCRYSNKGVFFENPGKGRGLHLMWKSANSLFRGVFLAKAQNLFWDIFFKRIIFTDVYINISEMPPPPTPRFYLHG